LVSLSQFHVVVDCISHFLLHGPLIDSFADQQEGNVQNDQEQDDEDEPVEGHFV
jgi:hypothetical protein